MGPSINAVTCCWSHSVILSLCPQLILGQLLITITWRSLLLRYCFHRSIQSQHFYESRCFGSSGVLTLWHSVPSCKGLETWSAVTAARFLRRTWRKGVWCDQSLITGIKLSDSRWVCLSPGLEVVQGRGSDGWRSKAPPAELTGLKKMFITVTWSNWTKIKK